MNRSLALAFVIGLSSLPLLSTAGELTPEEQSFFDQHVSEMVRFETQRLDDLAVEMVFGVPFYSVKVIIKLSDGEQSSSHVVARAGDNIVNVLSPGTDSDLPEFLKLLKPEFKLRTNSDAKAMQQALDVLYPVFMEREKKLISFKRAGNTWIFVRGEFFESKSGYIFEVDESGTIKSVQYQLRLPGA